ncbi:monocarboxylate transporter 4-like [Saccostrea echinata]|uniref:monocarboxylate transporter 4-like n=1 Tax=Saccostrea echinata TaxID=191078 RepID=UPI002A7F3B2A|nr:monocarboxylate transporter 4-like [Saccostrea echinata]
MFHFRKSTSSSVDKGWAWVVLFGCFMGYLIIIGMLKSFGLFFVEYQRKYSATSSVISMILSVQTIIASAVSIIIMGIGTRYIGERPLIIGTAFFGLASSVGNAYAAQASVLFFTQSTLFALTVASAFAPSTLILSKYFEKRRGMANAIANVGGSIGGLTFPPLYAYLFKEYGLQGTLIIAGGIFLHFIPIGMLMRPIERKEKLLQDIEEKDKSQDLVGKGLFEECLASNEIIKEESENEVKVNLIASNHSPQRKGSDGKLNSLQNSSEDDRNIQAKPSKLLGSSADISLTVSMEGLNLACSKAEIDNDVYDEEKGINCCLQFLFKLFDFSLFKNGQFILLMISILLVSAPSGIPITYIPPFAKDRGLQTDLIGYLVTISAASDLVGRILFVFIADNKKIERRHMMTIATVTNGIICFMAFFSTNFTYFAIFGILQAMFGGVYFSMINVLVIDFIGLDKLNYGIAFGAVMTGISRAVTSLVFGILRDSTGSYVSGFSFIGVCSILGGVFLLFKPCVSK